MAHRVETPYGAIFPTVGPCKDDYPNIVTHTTVAGTMLTMQMPAIRAWEAAEFRNGRKLPWKKHRKPKAIPVTGTLRSCSLQAHLYASDHDRYAAPETTRHCRGLAGDINTGFLNRRVRRCLIAEGFHFPRDDEPWHASYWESG